MLYTIKAGTDGLGSEFPGVDGIFADSIDEARELAAEKLHMAGYTDASDEGLFTVHGHRSWVLMRDERGHYSIQADDSPEPRVRSRRRIFTIDAARHAQRVNDYATGGSSLTDATTN